MLSHVALGDDHTLIVMFDKDGTCKGLQRVRGEERGQVAPQIGVDENNSTTNWGPEHHGLRTRLIVTADKPAVGREIKVACELKNFGNVSRTINPQGADYHRGLQVIAPDGRQSEYLYGPVGTIAADLEFKPGESKMMFADIDVTALFLMPTAGEYKLRLNGGDKAEVGEIVEGRAPIPPPSDVNVTLAAGELPPMQTLFLKLRPLAPNGWRVILRGQTMYFNGPGSSKLVPFGTEPTVVQLWFAETEFSEADEKARAAQFPNEKFPQLHRLGKMQLGFGHLTATGPALNEWPTCIEQIREQFAPQNQRAGDQMRKDPMLIPVSLTADNMPMQKVLEKLASGAGLKVEFDVEALKQVEIDLQQPITLSIENLPFNRAIGQVIDQRNHMGAMHEVRGDTLVLTTLTAWQNRIAERLPEWMKPHYNHGLLATLDDKNDVVSVTASSIVTDELLAKFATLSQLQELNIEMTKELTATGLAQLGKMPRLEKLNLYNVNTEGTGLGDDAIRGVSGSASLRELSIGECGTTDVGAKLLEQLPQLTTLSLRQEGHLTDEALKSIGKLTRLQSLSLDSYVGTARLGWMRFSASGIRQLSGLKELKSLQLVGQDVPADALEFPNLKTLSLGHPNVGDDVGVKIGELRSLQNLELSYCSMGDRGLEVIATLPKIRQFTISSTSVTDEGIEHFRTNKTLEHITLRVSGLTDQSLDNIAQIKTLTRLDLYGSGQPGVAPGRNFSMTGLQHLTTLPSLETLWLTNFDMHGYAELNKLTQLRELTMMMCNITDVEVEALEEALPNTYITHVTGSGRISKKFLKGAKN